VKIDSKSSSAGSGPSFELLNLRTFELLFIVRRPPTGTSTLRDPSSLLLSELALLSVVEAVAELPFRESSQTMQNGSLLGAGQAQLSMSGMLRIGSG
jgi:hypothetical protein